MEEIYGYARVSSKDQNEDWQVTALKNFGVPAEKIFVDRQSGKDFNRPQYKRLLRKLKSNTILVVKSIDRLGRNYEEILEQWRIITKEKRAAIVVLDMPLLDTRNKNDFLHTVIADLTLNIIAAFAQVERDAIHQRQAEAIAAAKARGVKFGREPLKRPENFNNDFLDWKAGKISTRNAAEILGVSNGTFLKWTRT